MSNTFLDGLKAIDNIDRTENGGITRKTTNSAVLDMFGLGAAYRTRSEDDIIRLFSSAFLEDPLLALKCLFYIGDCRGGQGERRFFRVAFKWLCKNYPDIAKKNLINIPIYRRWDDLIYATEGTPLEYEAFKIIQHQLAIDVVCNTPSLLAKWMPSQNASNDHTRRLGHKLASFLGLSSKEYRKILTTLRGRINVLETLMSARRWDEIKFDKIPSRAGLIYRNAFARKEVLAERYKEFAASKTTKVNAKVLYPQEIAHRVFTENLNYRSIADPERLMLQKYWDNLQDFYCGRDENGIAIVDVSGSMNGTPMEAAVSLGAYIADKAHGPFAGHFITFSGTPQLVKFTGADIVDKMLRCRQADWGMNTNIEAVFDMLLATAKKKNVKQEDMPTRLYIFSDMQFDACVTTNADSYGRYNLWGPHKNEFEIISDLEAIRNKWRAEGYDLPQVVFWNLRASQNNVPALDDNDNCIFSYVSGFSPSMIECILGGKTGYALMCDKLLSDRYKAIII